MIRAITIILLVCGFIQLEAQEEKKYNYTEATREIGINVMPLVNQFIPFKQSTSLTGPFSFTLRRGKNKNYFNFQLGLDVKEFFDDPSQIHLAVGFMRKSKTYNRFRYYTSFNFMGTGGPFNIPGEDPTFDSGGIGGSFGFGFEYQLNNFISLSTESMLYFGSRDFEFRPTFIPPVGIFLIGKLK